MARYMLGVTLRDRKTAVRIKDQTRGYSCYSYSYWTSHVTRRRENQRSSTIGSLNYKIYETEITCYRSIVRFFSAKNSCTSLRWQLGISRHEFCALFLVGARALRELRDFYSPKTSMFDNNVKS